MQSLKSPRGILLGYSSSVAGSILLILGGIFSSPSEPGNALFMGLSFSRLILALGLFAACIFFISITVRAYKNNVWAEQTLEKWFEGKGISQGLAWLSGISFGLGWIGCFLPMYRAGALSNYWVRIQPVMVFMLIAGLATLIVFFIVRIKDLDLAPLRLGVPLFVISLLVVGVMFYSRFGVFAVEDFWYGAGVPILASQMIAVILGGVLFLHFGSASTSKREDVLISILIFVVTAFLWSRAPLQKSFLFTGPSLPNQVFYPFADAALFDSASQFALIGQKIFIFNSLFFERPLYLSFLIYLHSLFGQDFELLMAVQAGVFAILPVLVYLIGRSLDLRAAGLASALAIMLRGLNSISASNMLDTANPKMILTDFPTAIGVALIILLTCEWLKDPDKKRHYPVWIGGAIGFALMLRTNALILFAFIPLYAFFVLLKKWKAWVLSSFLILLGVISITLPWEIRNQSLGGQMYAPIVVKFRNVIQQRYSTPDSFLPHQQAYASVTLRTTQVITSLQPVYNSIQDAPSCNTVLCFSTNHFLHNIITALLSLPTSPMLDDLRHLIRERAHYWQADWDGSLNNTARFFLTLNLFLVSTGIALAWKKKRLLGLVPLATFIAYNLSNGLARTSGGRYLVPADWILIFYYVLGILQIVTWCANTVGIQWHIFNATPESKTSGGAFPSNMLGAFTALLLFGSLLPLSETLHLPRYQNMDPAKALADNRALLEQANLKLNDLDTFLQNPDAKILVGRALYPRYYKANQGEFVGAFYPYQTLEFPRIAFRLIGPAGDYPVILPGDIPEYFPHTSDMLVLGCNGAHYFDALVVIVLDDRGAIYTRAPKSELQCPLSQPVCDNNSNCQ